MSTDPLLSIRDLSVAFRQGGRETLAVDRVSFDVGKGEAVALVGSKDQLRARLKAYKASPITTLGISRHPTFEQTVGLMEFFARELL